LRTSGATVTAVLFCGAPDDPATSPGEQANLYATLTEINHYQDPTVSFSAQYGIDGPRLGENHAPFNAVYLMTMPHRTPGARRDVLSRLSSYLFHEITTPLGLRLENCRHVPQGEAVTPFRSFGTYSVWFPRGLLVRQAARQAALVLVSQWRNSDQASASAEIHATCSRLLADPGVRPEALSA